VECLSATSLQRAAISPPLTRLRLSVVFQIVRNGGALPQMKG